MTPNIFSICSGVDMPLEAFSKEKLKHNFIGYCEIDDGVAYAHQTLWGKQWRIKNVCNISDSELKKLKKSNLNLIYCTCPCQSFSPAGYRLGGGGGFNSSKGDVSIQTMMLIDYLQPEVAIMENSSEILNKTNIDKLTQTINQLGYKPYYTILNSSQFNVPQNRERSFVILIRKDIYKKNGKDFDKQLKSLATRPTTKKTVKNILDKNESKRKCISDSMMNNLLKDNIFSNNLFNQYCKTGVNDKLIEKIQNHLINKNLLEKHKTGAGFSYLIEVPNTFKCRSKILFTDGVSPTLTTVNEHIYYDLGFKALTSKERLRLMGMGDNNDAHYHSLKNAGICETKINKIAGNGVVVDVFAALVKEVYKYMNWY